MHPDAVGDLLHLERLDRLRTLREKSCLVVDDRLRGLQQCAAALLDRLDQPLGCIDLPLDVFAGGSGRGRRMEHLTVGWADSQIRQIDVFKPNLPGAVGMLFDVDIGLHDRHKRLREHGPGLRFEPVELLAQLLFHLAQLVVTNDDRQPVSGQVFEMVADQTPQLPGVWQVGPDLQEQAFLEVAGTNPRRIHSLHHSQRLLQLRKLVGWAIRIAELLQRHREIAIDVEVVDDPVGRLPLAVAELVV